MKKDKKKTLKGKRLNEVKGVREEGEVKYRGGRKRKEESASSCKCYNKTAGCPHKMTKQEQRQKGRGSRKGG